MTDARMKKTKSVRVLLVEDEPALRDIYATKMRIEGYEVIEAADGIDGLEHAVREAPAIVLLDIVMPIKNGFEVLRDLKANPKTRAIPVVILTNLGQDYEIKQGIALGAERFLTKANLTPAKMVEEVEDVLSKLVAAEVGES